MAADLRTTRTLARWVTRAHTPRLLRALAPAWVLLALAVVQADAVVDWDQTSASLMARTAFERAAIAVVLAALWAPGTGTAIRAAARTDADWWRWRVPIDGWRRAAGLAPVWAVAVLPLAMPGALLGLPIALPAAAIHPVLAWAAGRRLESAAGAFVALPVLWAASAAPLGLVLAAVGAWRGVAVLHAEPPPAGTAARSRWRPRGPMRALWWRDLLALWRLERGLVLGALFVSGPAYAVQSTAVRNYPLVGESAVRAGLLILTLAGTVAASAVLALPTRLGSALDPRQAPFSTTRRAALLAAVSATLTAPALIAVLAGGSGGLPRLLAHGTALSAGAAWFAVGLGRRTDADRTTFLWWVIVLGLLAFAPFPHQPLVALGLAGLAIGGTSRSLAWARRRP